MQPWFAVYFFDIGYPKLSKLSTFEVIIIIIIIHVMINWLLPKQGIRWPVSRYLIVGSSLQLALQNSKQNYTFSWVSLIWLWTTRPRGLFLESSRKYRAR